jgi:hypothetical protein
MGRQQLPVGDRSRTSRAGSGNGMGMPPALIFMSPLLKHRLLRRVRPSPARPAIWRNHATPKSKLFLLLATHHRTLTSDRRMWHNMQDQTLHCFDLMPLAQATFGNFHVQLLHIVWACIKLDFISCWLHLTGVLGLECPYFVNQKLSQVFYYYI